MKAKFEYTVSFRGTKKECLDLEKLFNSKLVSVEQMKKWDDVNDEENPPSGIITWSKSKYLKFSDFLIYEKNRLVTKKTI